MRSKTLIKFSRIEMRRNVSKGALMNLLMAYLLDRNPGMAIAGGRV